MNKLNLFFRAFRELTHFSHQEVAVTLILKCIQAVTAGIGILLLIPMLEIIGLEADKSTSSVTDFFRNTLESLSIPLNLASMLVVYVMVLSLVAVIQYVTTLKITRIHQKLIVDVRTKLHQAIVKSDWSLILNNSRYNFNHLLTLQVQSMGTAFQLLLVLSSYTIMIAGYSLLTAYLSWQVTLVALISGICLSLVIAPYNRKIYLVGQNELLGFKDVFRMIGEQLSSLKMIKSYSAETHFTSQLEQVGRQLEQQIINAKVLSEKSKLVYTIGTAIFIALIVFLSTAWLSLAFSSLIILLVVFSKLLPNIANAAQTVNQLFYVLPSIDGIYETINSANLQTSVDGKTSRGTDLTNLQNVDSIEFKNVSFVYQGSEQKVIDNLSFSIRTPGVVAFHGASGAGKTTAVDLLTGLLTPTDGQILINQIDLQAINPSSWRKQIAYVTQENHLFHQTVRENLNWVAPEVSDDEIWRVLELASASDFVKNLPRGLDTNVGDNGGLISGGERQRLAIARALLLQPSVLILDEATSALDSVNKACINRTLSNLKGKLTLFIIAHDNTSYHDVDTIINFNQIDYGAMDFISATKLAVN